MFASEVGEIGMGPDRKIDERNEDPWISLFHPLSGFPSFGTALLPQSSDSHVVPVAIWTLPWTQSWFVLGQRRGGSHIGGGRGKGGNDGRLNRLSLNQGFPFGFPFPPVQYCNHQSLSLIWLKGSLTCSRILQERPQPCCTTS